MTMQGKPPTPAQLELLRQLGHQGAVKDRADASRLIGLLRGGREVFTCSERWLAERLEVSQRQVRKALASLLDQGSLVLVEDHREKRRARTWVHYRFGTMGSALRPPVTRGVISASESHKEVGK